MTAQGKLPRDESAALDALRCLVREVRAVRAAQKAGTANMALWHAREAVIYSHRLVYALEDLLTVPARERQVWNTVPRVDPA